MRTDRTHLPSPDFTPAYDGWLDKHFAEIPGKLTVLELGCGWGDDTSFLSGTGHTVTSCDIEEDKLDMIKTRYPGVMTKMFDMRGPFPFDSSTADIIVASLCLHFFMEDELHGILSEIRRILKSSGTLLCRLNSEKGYIPGIAGETELAPGTYMTSGGLKLFYNAERIKSVFKDWDILSIDEYETAKLTKRVKLLEAVLKPLPLSYPL